MMSQRFYLDITTDDPQMSSCGYDEADSHQRRTIHVGEHTNVVEAESNSQPSSGYPPTGGTEAGGIQRAHPVCKPAPAESSLPPLSKLAPAELCGRPRVSPMRKGLPPPAAAPPQFAPVLERKAAPPPLLRKAPADSSDNHSSTSDTAHGGRRRSCRTGSLLFTGASKHLVDTFEHEPVCDRARVRIDC